MPRKKRQPEKQFEPTHRPVRATRSVDPMSTAMMSARARVTARHDESAHQATPVNSAVPKKPHTTLHATPQRTHKKWSLKPGFVVIGVILLVLLGSLVFTVRDVYGLSSPTFRSRDTAIDSVAAEHYTELRDRATDVIAKAKGAEITVIDETELWQELDAIKIDLATDNTTLAEIDMQQTEDKIAGYEHQVDDIIASRSGKAKKTTKVEAGIFTPIVIYHYTPAGFETQIKGLLARGYTGVTMSELYEGLRDPKKLPPKPVAITFDDGYSDQLNAFNILKKYNMKATFYIITSGQASNWCIGMDRRHDQAVPCGDTFLNEDDVKMLDASGLIEIGAHTVDHLALAGQNTKTQMFQISESKHVLEKLLGHSVTSFAYPYGSYNQSAITQVMNAGFTTAVTTADGTNHTTSDLFTLSRTRDPGKLK